MAKTNSPEKITFNDFDKLNLTSFAENLLKNIESGLESDIGQKGSYTISLDAEFGNGKTTFLEMFTNFIKDKKPNYSVLSINAWESDFYGEPIVSILHNFIDLIEKANSKTDDGGKTDAGKKQIDKQDIKDKTIKVLGKIINYKATRVIGNIVNQVIKNTTTFDMKDAIEPYLDNNKPQNADQCGDFVKGEGVLAELNQKRDIIREIKEIILEYTKDKKLLIIVDELDRARPDYAVSFLEDIKHFFDIENVVFLVAVNREQMEATVKCLYGQDLKFGGYYRKFFKQEIKLPDPYREAQKFVNNLIQKTEVKFNEKDQPDKQDKIQGIYSSCKLFCLTLREVEQFMRIFSEVLKHSSVPLNWIYMGCYSFFICLFIKEKGVFNRVLNKNLQPNELLDNKRIKTGIDNTTNHDEKYSVSRLLSIATIFSIDMKKEKENSLNIKHQIANILGFANTLHIDHIFENFDSDYHSITASDICKKIEKCENHFLK